MALARFGRRVTRVAEPPSTSREADRDGRDRDSTRTVRPQARGCPPDGAHHARDPREPAAEGVGLEAPTAAPAPSPGHAAADSKPPPRLRIARQGAGVAPLPGDRRVRAEDRAL